MTKQRKLSAQESNRLAVQMQVLRIKLIEFARKYAFNGKSTLWGQELDEYTLQRERAKLAELDRVQVIHETAAYRNLPYFPSGGGGTVKKIKERYLKAEGTIAFIEVKESSHGQSVTNHLQKKKTIKRRIKHKQSSTNRKIKQMSTKRKTKEKVDDDLLGFINTDAIDAMLDGVAGNIPAYRPGDKIEFVHAGGKIKGSVLKSLSQGKIKAVDAGATVYMISPDDILKTGETASQLIGRNKKGGKKTEDLIGVGEPALDKKVVKKDLKKIVEKAKQEVKGDKERKPKAKTGEKTQRELVEDQLIKGERDYDKIAEKTKVTRVNVGQYAYRWFKANPKVKK